MGSAARRLGLSDPKGGSLTGKYWTFLRKVIHKGSDTAELLFAFHIHGFSHRLERGVFNDNNLLLSLCIPVKITDVTKSKSFASCSWVKHRRRFSKRDMYVESSPYASKSLEGGSSIASTYVSSPVPVFGLFPPRLPTTPRCFPSKPCDSPYSPSLVYSRDYGPLPQHMAEQEAPSIFVILDLAVIFRIRQPQRPANGHIGNETQAIRSIHFVSLLLSLSLLFSPSIIRTLIFTHSRFVISLTVNLILTPALTILITGASVHLRMGHWNSLGRH